MADDLGFSIEGWDEFVNSFSHLVDRWDAKKQVLLRDMGETYHAKIIPWVPVDTSRLVDNIFVFDDGIRQDYIEVGTNVEYALYVNDGHVQHRRFLPAERLSVKGRTKYLKDGAKGIMLSERYVPGKFFMEKGLNDAKPDLESLVDSWMTQILREVEGGRL